MVSHVEMWGCLYMGKNERSGESSSPCPGYVCGPSITGASCRKKSWEQTPFHVGCARRMPREGALPGTGTAAQLQHSRCRKSAARLSSSAAHACGGERSLLSLENSSAFCTAKSSRFSATHKKTPTTKARGLFSHLLPPFVSVLHSKPAWAGSGVRAAPRARRMCGLLAQQHCPEETLCEGLACLGVGGEAWQGLEAGASVQFTCMFMALLSASRLGGVGVGWSLMCSDHEVEVQGL